MPRIVVSPLAQADLDEIWDHIARDSVLNADRFIDRIEQRFELLAANPRLGVARDDLRPGLRRFPHANYLIYYRPVRGGIEVVRVVHGARNRSRCSSADAIGAVASGGRPPLLDPAIGQLNRGKRRGVAARDEPGAGHRCRP